MPLVKNITSFSPDGEYFAYSCPDGCLKIWEVSTRILKQEYTPSSHLSSRCSTISWSPSKSVAHAPKRHKKDKNAPDFKAVSDLQLIAMGTLTGDILLYSYNKADLHSCFSNGHAGIVNDLCWCASTCSLYSCSSDNHIVKWDVFTGEIEIKWKADKNPVHAICLTDRNHLLSASNAIKLWNIKEKTVLKTFTGHASEIFRLISLGNGKDSENSYFLSAAVGDRVINAWQLNLENSSRATASFLVCDEPENISAGSSKDGHIMLSVTCKDGSSHIFEHVINGYKKKPVNAKFSLQIASAKTKNHRKPERIPILCSTISLGLNNFVFSYGSFLKPNFEIQDLSEANGDIFLIRDTSLSSSVVDDDVQRVKQTDKSEKVKILAPGHLMSKTNASLQKRKKKDTDIKELPMEERLKALDLSKVPVNLEQESTLKADSMVHLLLQGLQSNDTNMINTVLQFGNESIIQNTIKKLPLQSIILLLKELQLRLSRKDHSNNSYLKWMTALLSIHLPYLMSCKDVCEYLGSINQLIQARIENLSKMLQLQGCLKILLEQTTNKSEIIESDEPLVVYQSESSEESDAEDVDHNADSSDEEPASATSEDSSSSEIGSEYDDMDS